MPDLWMDVDVALSEVPVNIMPLIEAADFLTVDEGVTYDEAGMTLFWHFTKPDGTTTVTAVTPTTAGDYDWAHQDHGMYTIEVPASGGASINNTEEGFGWFTGNTTATTPWRGPIIGFRAASLNNIMVEGDGSEFPTAAEIVTAMEADGTDLEALMKAIVYKAIWDEVSGDMEQFNAAGVSQGTTAGAFTSDGSETTRKKLDI